jgi:RNA polymerase primary sigma factor
MEVMKIINDRSSKARSTRKSRSIDSGRKAKPARASGSLRAGKPRRVARVVKAHAGSPEGLREGSLPVPANDTLPLPDEALPIEAVAGRGVEVGIEEIEVEVAESAASVGLDAAEESPESALVAAEAPDADDEARERAEEEEEEQEAATTARAADGKKRRADEEPASFLAMYFRDMAELDVLRPEQEFETARNIEQLELDLWRTVLGFAPGTAWVLDVVEREVGKPLNEAKLLRASAERARRKSSIQARSRFDKACQELGAKLRVLDIDRLFIDAALAEIQRVGRATRGLPFEGTVTFSTSTKAFADYVRTVAGKALRLKAAKNEFVKANLRLVVSIARRFNHGRLPLADLIQEGNIGLMKAVERYDYRRGFRFSTYASWWIRHAISRALADKGRAVRIPVHMLDTYNRVSRATQTIIARTGKEPTIEELEKETGVPRDKLDKVKDLYADTPFSLDRPVGDEDGRRFIDFLVEENSLSPYDCLANAKWAEEVKRLLGTLTPIESRIIRWRFGLDNEDELTLKEIGDKYNLSRERIRQLQEQALGKIRKQMRDF